MSFSISVVYVIYVISVFCLLSFTLAHIPLLLFKSGMKRVTFETGGELQESCLFFHFLTSNLILLEVISGKKSFLWIKFLKYLKVHSPNFQI